MLIFIQLHVTCLSSGKDASLVQVGFKVIWGPVCVPLESGGERPGAASRGGAGSRLLGSSFSWSLFSCSVLGTMSVIPAKAER